jgi:hypothetical protein
LVEIENEINLPNNNVSLCASILKQSRKSLLNWAVWHDKNYGERLERGNQGGGGFAILLFVLVKWMEIDYFYTIYAFIKTKFVQVKGWAQRDERESIRKPQVIRDIQGEKPQKPFTAAFA